MKHKGYTPGPWRWRTDDENVILESNASPAILGSILRVDTSAGLIARQPDARLIADAPRLAEENEKLRALLTRAEGLSTRVIESEILYCDRVAADLLRQEIRAALAEKKG